MKLTITLLGIVSLVACFDPHAHDSSIVRRVEAAGSGDLSTYDPVSLGVWFSNRPALATEIATACLPREKNAAANWSRSAEGSVCRAATIAAPAPEPIADRSRAW